MAAGAAFSSSKRHRDNMQSQRNLSCSTGEASILAESMPALHARRQKSLSPPSVIDDSVRTDPGLYHRPTPQGIEEDQPGDAIRASASPRKPSLKAKDSFNDNEPVESMRRPDSRGWWPRWMDPACNVRLFAGKIVNDNLVQGVILLLIVINAIMMGVATFDVVKTDPDLAAKFDLADHIFLIIFTIESSMQLIYYGWSLFLDGFLVFDLLIVVMGWALEGTQVVRSFRIFRALRLITRVDTMKKLVVALFSVAPKMAAIAMLLLLIFYIFSVMFTQLFKDMYEEDLVSFPYFSTLYDSLFTLFQFMTLDNWADVSYEIQATYSWAWLPFVIFIALTGFVVVNLIIAVICDAVHVLSKEDKAGLYGFDLDDYPPEANEANSYEGDMQNTRPTTITEQRLEELQQQLDDMVIGQEKMKTVIAVLVEQLR